MAKKRTGRPSLVITKKTIEQMPEMSKDCNTLHEFISKLPGGRSTIYNILASDDPKYLDFQDSFKREAEKIASSSIDSVESELFKIINLSIDEPRHLAAKLRAIEFFLSRVSAKYKIDFREQKEAPEIIID